MEAFATVYVLLFLFGIVWIIVPFALIGTKPILRELLEEMRTANRLLEQRESKSDNSAPAFPSISPRR